ncbi:DinB family protein [Bacillus sp. DNRA2]|uniref:DinB family protein n=1 Tax=Bacillus sp. DNRA2 TaxID=2723053 RepID=UPI00145E4057|nr:DinB family protein [Bacillus sp. DNRA2]NMD69386.1 DinB family protein [Bacillus sp. DNRA2]
MKSQSMRTHFLTLKQQRDSIFPTLKSLSMAQLWERPEENKWSIGESIYHLLLIIKKLRVASIITIPCTRLYAKMTRNKPFDCEINDIYKEYKEKHGKGMKSPFILNPLNKINNTMGINEMNQLLIKETANLMKLVEDIDEDIAGHIIFLDPIANYPNLIQAIQLLAIHEEHHLRIVRKDLEALNGRKKESLFYE